MGKRKDERTSSIYCYKQAKVKPQSIAHDIQDYHWVMFKHAMEFLETMRKPYKVTSKTLFY
jgi:hypothetical protein